MKRTPPKNPDRRRTAARLIALALLAGAATLRALDPTEWKFRQTVSVDAAGIVTVALPPETLDAARGDLGDLRIVDAAGQEVAFLVQRETRPQAGNAPVKSFHSSLTEAATQLTIECGDLPVRELTLETPARDFVKRAQIETSRDGSVWQVVTAGMPLFRQASAEQLRIGIVAPFIRVTIDDTRSAPIAFTGARATLRPSRDILPLPARITRRDEFAGETLLTVELAAAHTTLEALALTTPERLFNRRVTIGVRDLQDEAAVERTLATGTIFRLDADPSASRESVLLNLIAPSRELLVHIVNEDSPPLAVSGVTATRFAASAVFDAPAPGAYALLTGHPLIAAPRYDVSAMRMKKPARDALAPGPLTANPGYRPPEALAGTALLGAALDPAPWTYRRAVQLAAAGVHQLELDVDVLAHAQRGFADLRLLRDGLQVPYLLERPALSRSIELAPVAANDPKRPHLSRWQLKLPRAGLPVTRLTLDSPATLFQRQLRVFEVITDDRGNTFERALAGAAWSRTPGDKRPLIISVGLPPATDTVLIETDNGDNPPIALASATVAHPVARLLFKSDQVPLTLYYGNEQSAAPRYDLALVARQILTAEKAIATLAPEEKARPDGWTPKLIIGGKSGLVFWAVLALVVVVLLVLVARLLPKPPGAPAAK